METTRQNKIGRLLQKEISDIFQRGTPYSGALITVTKAKVTSDLSIARIYLSIFATGAIKKEDVLAKITSNVNQTRRELGTRVRNQLRIIPALEFYIDDSLDYIEKIENLLKQ
jgi:ribosome-binding factor A